MKKGTISLLKMSGFMALLVLSALAQPVFAGCEEGVKLSVSETDIEYGWLDEGPPVIREVTLRNMGDKEIRIGNVRSS